MELLLDYHTRSRSNNIQIEQTVNEVTTSQQPEKEQIPCSSTNHNIKLYQKNHQKKKKIDNPLLLESPKSKEFQPPDLQIDFLIDSGAELISLIFQLGMKSKLYTRN